MLKGSVLVGASLQQNRSSAKTALAMDVSLCEIINFCLASKICCGLAANEDVRGLRQETKVQKRSSTWLPRCENYAALLCNQNVLWVRRDCA